MAIDRWLLDQLEAGGPPCLRLYRWSTPTLSLGRHQVRLEPHWPGLVEQGRISVVRRPSGGRAVLHAGDLTYALACRPAGTQRQQAYRDSCQWLQQAFAEAGQPLQWGGGPSGGANDGPSGGRFVEAHGRSSCFATATGADLIHANGAKRVGSAQLWRGGLLLQHGSLLLDPPADLWRDVFGAPPPGLAPLPWGADALEAQLRRSAERWLCGGPLVEQPLSPAEWRQIEAYSPLASMALATDGRPMPSG
jgi:lipoate-protein ligase A